MALEDFKIGYQIAEDARKRGERIPVTLENGQQTYLSPEAAMANSQFVQELGQRDRLAKMNINAQAQSDIRRGQQAQDLAALQNRFESDRIFSQRQYDLPIRLAQISELRQQGRVNEAKLATEQLQRQLVVQQLKQGSMMVPTPYGNVPIDHFARVMSGVNQAAQAEQVAKETAGMGDIFIPGVGTISNLTPSQRAQAGISLQKNGISLQKNDASVSTRDEKENYDIAKQLYSLTTETTTNHSGTKKTKQIEPEYNQIKALEARAQSNGMGIVKIAIQLPQSWGIESNKTVWLMLPSDGKNTHASTESYAQSIMAALKAQGVDDKTIATVIKKDSKGRLFVDKDRVREERWQ